jgi:undecaprenyl-diphosphatase
LLWWAWFRNRATSERDRGYVISGIVLSVVALLITRCIALMVPFRLRPRYIPGLHFHLPSGSANYDMIDWSSFPSDHAVLYFCLATCIFFISRKAGAFALLHAFFVVCMTRIYLGIHYPTDILAGMAIGVGTASLSLNHRVRELIARPAQRWMDKSPRSFYPILSLSMLIIATEFDPLREVIVDVWRAAKGLSHL